MRHRVIASRRAAASALAIVLYVSPVSAQEAGPAANGSAPVDRPATAWTVPRTPDGQPAAARTSTATC